MVMREGRKAWASNGYVSAPCPNGGACAGGQCSPARPAPVHLYNDHMETTLKRMAREASGRPPNTHRKTLKPGPKKPGPRGRKPRETFKTQD